MSTPAAGQWGPSSPFDIAGISAAIDRAASSLKPHERGALAACAPCPIQPSNPVMLEPNGGKCRLCTVRKFKSKTPGAPDEPVCSEAF